MKQRCYICHSGDTKAERLTLSAPDCFLNILICQECGHASRIDQPDLASNLRIQQDKFDERAQKPRFDLPWYNRRMLVAARMERMLCKEGKILDIGCGSGQWLAILGKKWDKYGVELSPKAARLAEQFTNAKIFCGSIETYNIEPETFDVITAFALIEHLKDPRKLVQWMYAHLKPGGGIVLMTVDRESEKAKSMGDQWPMYIPQVHLNFFTCRSLGHLVGEIGFVIKRREWRPMLYGRESSLKLYLEKTREIFGILGKPRNDHLYLYAQKPG